MTIQPTASATTGAAATPGLFGQSGADFTMFLRLLTTQMQNQDPLDPMDTSQYTQQLVQYSQVEQSLQQTGVLKDILARLSGSDMAQASGLIGREVEFDSAVAGLTAASPASWSWSLPRNAASITAEIVDSSGRTVATPAIAAGAERFSWDGTLPDGSRAPEGAYVLKLTATDASGATIPATIHSHGRVREVLQSEGELWLGIGGVSLPLGELTRVVAGDGEPAAGA